MKKILIKKINNSYWWHVPPRDPEAYKKRGKFLASTYLQAEFYGRPNEKPEKVNIVNPVFGFSEIEILKQLFNKNKAKNLLKVVVNTDRNFNFYEKRVELDVKIHNRAKRLGFDAVVLMGKSSKNSLLKHRKPNSIELNLVFKEEKANEE